MKSHEITQGSVFPKRYLVKRRIVRDETTLANGSIFSVVNKRMSDFTQGDTIKNNQTMTTTLEHNLTIQTSIEQSVSNEVKSTLQQMLPKLTRQKKQVKSLDKSIIEAEQSPTNKGINPNQHFNHHISDPLYVRLEKKLSVRVQDRFLEYKKGWMKYCMRRKEKSVIERSLQRANKTIENIQSDARKRRNTTHLQQLVRNNILEKTFIMPAKFKAEIQGLKGRGGKVLPLYEQNYLSQQVYKIDRSHR